MKCKKCDSENIQKLSIIYAGGISTIDASSTDYSTNSIGVSDISGTSQTALSEVASPPKKLPFFSIIFYSSIAMFLIYTFFEQASEFWTAILVMTIFGVMFSLLRVSYKYNYYKFPGQFEEWNKKFMCLKCSEIFKVD